MNNSIDKVRLEQKKLHGRANRGEVTEEFVARFQNCTDRDLLTCLEDTYPQNRTAAAMVLGKRKSREAIPFLGLQLSREKALYSKIAVSNALGEIGTAALPELMKYIGKIGRNQHHDLPQTIFKKWDYPLPRDIAARTIVKIGQPALRILNDYLPIEDDKFISEGIDAIGHISFYAPDQSSYESIAALLEKRRGNKVIVWKIIRALQAFPNNSAVAVLADFLLYGEIAQHRWEAARSLGQIAAWKAAEHLKTGLSDRQCQVREMAELALNHIYKKRNGFISLAPGG